MALAKEAGAKRALKLSVSGAFHSPLMAPAELAFSGAIERTDFATPTFPVFSNVTERACTDPDTARELLLQQLTSPVRWMGEVTRMAEAYPDATFIELGPGNVLCGLVSRIVPGARTAPCGTADDVTKVLEMIS